MRKAFRYRLFTTPLQSEALAEQLGEACRLYNAALQERRDAWKQRISLNYYDQANQLKDIRASGDLGLANFSCCTEIGIDVGLKSFATLSSGKSIPNPRWQHQAEAKLRRAQRRVARRKKGSHRRSKAVALLQKVFNESGASATNFSTSFLSGWCKTTESLP